MWKKFKDWWHSVFYVAPCRKGFLKFEAEGGGLINRGQEYSFNLRVAELENVNGMSKILVLSGGNGYSAGSIQQYINEWIPSESVVWD